MIRANKTIKPLLIFLLSGLLFSQATLASYPARDASALPEFNTGFYQTLQVSSNHCFLPVLLSSFPLGNLKVFAIMESPGEDLFSLEASTESAANQSRVNSQNPSGLWSRFLETYRTAGLKVKILLVILVYLIFSLLSLFTIIVLNRSLKTRKRRHAKEMKHTYQEELTNFLFGEEDQPYEFTGINFSANREIFLNELLSLHNNLYGEAANRLRDLYFNLGLYKTSLAKVQARRWDHKAKGFRELSQMDVKDASQQISKYVNSKNKVLRMEAHVALVKISEDDPLFFLDDLNYELSEWEQVNILNTLNYHHIFIDSFERWLDSPNDSVAIFAAKMTGYYKHTHEAPKLANLLSHQNPNVRYHAIKALGQLEIPENIDDLKGAFKNEIPDENERQDALLVLMMEKNRKAALDAIYPLATHKELDFLEEILMNEPVFGILKAAAKTMVSTGEKGREYLEKIYRKADPELRKIIENVKQKEEVQ